MRKIFESPAVYEFASPIAGTYPLLYDPSYWNEGVLVSLADLKTRTRAWIRVPWTFYSLFVKDLSGLLVCFFILWYTSGRGRGWFKDILESWIVLVPVATALGVYGAIGIILPRYFGAFAVLFWMGLFSALRLPASPVMQQLTKGIAMAMLAVTTMINVPTFGKTFLPLKERLSPENASPHPQWEMTEGLRQMGVLPGDSVATLGSAYYAGWARLARVRIIAEIPSEEIKRFFDADPETLAGVFRALSETGVKAIVTIPVLRNALFDPTSKGWRKLGNTDYYAHLV